MSLDREVTRAMELQGSNNTAWDGKALIVSYARPDVLRQAKIEALERKVRMRIQEERASAAYDAHALDGAGPSSTSSAADVHDEHHKAQMAAAHLGGRDQVKVLVVPPQVTQHGEEVRGSSHLIIEGQKRNYQRLLGQHAAAAGGGAAGSGGGAGGVAGNHAGAGRKREGAEAGDAPGGGPLPRYRTSDVGMRPDVPKKKVPWGGGGAPYRRPKPKPDPMKVALGTGMLAYVPARVQQPCGLRNAFVTQAQAIEEARIDYEAVKPRRPASAQPLRPAFQHRVSGGGGGGGGGGRDSDGGEHVAPGDVAAALAASYLQQQVAPGAGGGSGLDKWRDVPMVRVTEVDLMAEYRARSQREAAAAAAAQHAGDPAPTGRSSPRIHAVVRSASMSAQGKAGAAVAAAAAAAAAVTAAAAAPVGAGHQPGPQGDSGAKPRRSTGVRVVSPQEEAAAQGVAAAAAAGAASSGSAGSGRTSTHGKAPARGHSVTSISASGSTAAAAAAGSASTRTHIAPGAAQTPGFLRVRPQSASSASAPRLSPPRPASVSPASPTNVYAPPPRSHSPIRRPASASAASRPTAWGSSTQIPPRLSRPPVHPHSAFPTSQSLSATSLGQHRTTYQPVPPEARRARPGSAVPTSKTNSRTRGAARDSLLGSCSGAPWTTSTSAAGGPVIPPGLQQHLAVEGSPGCSISASGWAGTPGQSASGGTSSAGISLSGGAAVLPVDPWATLSTSRPTTTDRPLLQDRVLNYTARQYAMSPEEEEEAVKQAAAVPGAAAGAAVTRGSVSGGAAARRASTGMAAADAAATLAAQRQQQRLAASLAAAAAAAAAAGGSGSGGEGLQRTRPQSAPNRRLRPPSAGHWAGRPDPGALRGVQRSPTGAVYDPELQPSPVGNYVNAVADLALD